MCALNGDEAPICCSLLQSEFCIIPYNTYPRDDDAICLLFACLLLGDVANVHVLVAGEYYLHVNLNSAIELIHDVRLVSVLLFIFHFTSILLLLSYYNLAVLFYLISL